MYNEDDKQLYSELIHNVNSQVDIMEEITNTLLTATKFESGSLTLTKRVTDITAMIREITSMFKYKAKNMDLKVEFLDEKISAVIDSDEIKKVIKNILSNAFKYSKENSVVCVRVSSDVRNFMVSVTDYGIGIDPHEMPKIFDKFYRTDRALTRKTGGMGFGLYISKIIVEQHGGSIWAESLPDKGSTFHIKIPKEI
jgi:signal transduction histidine kinase